MCAANPAGECTSAYSNEAIATAHTFIAAPNYEDATLSGAPAGTVIKRAHVAQLRVGATRGVGASGGGGGGGGGTTGAVRWMVADQLGTPRMTIDQTGSLAGVRRRDFLPFGEEIGAGVGGRTTAQGYSQPSGIRQGFTGYEKDGETGLNFAQSRYHSPTMGRFTSPDKLFADQHEDDPQSWNLYAYAGNNPLLFTDPTGMWRWVDPENNGHRFLQWEEDDDWVSLARFLNRENPGNVYSPSMLEEAFGRVIGLGPDLIIDVEGAVPRFTNQRGVENVGFDTLMNVTPGGRGAKAGGGLLSRLWNWVRGRGAKRTTTGVVRKSIPALRQEYEDAVRNLSSVARAMREAGHSAEEIAIKLHGERRALGVKYKVMPNENGLNHRQIKSAVFAVTT